MLPPSVLRRKPPPSGHDLAKWFDFNPLKHALRDVRIALRKGLRRRLVLELRNYQTATAVGERPTHHDLAARDQRLQIFQMRRAYRGPQRRSVGTVVTDNYEEHRRIQPRCKFPFTLARLRRHAPAKFQRATGQSQPCKQTASSLQSRRSPCNKSGNK